MNVLDKVYSILGDKDAKLGFMPDEPDKMTGIFEYQASPLVHSFSGSDVVQNVQVRCRGTTDEIAYQAAKAAVMALDRYHDDEVSILQNSAILDIGRDSKMRQEYTVNFTIRRY